MKTKILLVLVLLIFALSSVQGEALTKPRSVTEQVWLVTYGVYDQHILAVFKSEAEADKFIADLPTDICLKKQALTLGVVKGENLKWAMHCRDVGTKCDSPCGSGIYIAQ